ncbi:hypothetical protein V6N13_127467 [Hibiscus sabdariffa]
MQGIRESRSGESAAVKIIHSLRGHIAICNTLYLNSQGKHLSGVFFSRFGFEIKLWLVFGRKRLFVSGLRIPEAWHQARRHCSLKPRTLRCKA